jgi:hypothetical protein
MVMTFIDKTEYINNDFRNSALIALGEIPHTRSEAETYFDKAIKAASTFMLKYKGKGRQVENYVRILVTDFMDELERKYGRLYGSNH